MIRLCEEERILGRKWLVQQGVATLDSVLWEQSILGRGGSYRELNGLNQQGEGRSQPVFDRVSATSYGEKRDPIG